MTTNETPAAPANVAPAVWGRYLRAAVAERTATTTDARESAAYEARYVARTVGIDEAAVEPLVIAEVERLTPELGDYELGDPTSARPGESADDWATRVYGADVEVEVVDGEPVLDRTTRPAALTDRALWVLFMAEDRALAGYDDDPNEPDDDRHGALTAEIARRFGPDATELTADYAVGLHMSSDDLVRWALDEHEHLVAIATGRLVPEWRAESIELGDAVQISRGPEVHRGKRGTVRAFTPGQLSIAVELDGGRVVFAAPGQLDVERNPA